MPHSLGIQIALQTSMWFNTLSSLGPENVTFTDRHAQQPAVHCASIPRRAGDNYELFRYVSLYRQS